MSLGDVDTSTPFVAYAQVNAAANNTAYPTITTDRLDTLLMYVGGNATNATTIPSCIEGPVTQTWSWDGFAHADVLGWSIQSAIGVTPSTVISSVTGTSYTGKLITVGVRAPSAGATVVPAYCAADLSVYVDPIQGTTAFRGNTAFAGTATTYFTGNISGKTVADATITARTDQGINTYRTCGGLNSSTARTWVGAANVLVGGNVLTSASGKNILSHVMPYLPADMQTLEGIGLGRGVAFGAYTSAGNFKVWHVHGANTPWGIKRVPVVINTGNTSGVIQTTGTLNAASIAGFGMFSSGFTVSADLMWTMTWVLDTTTVCGGNAAYPIDVPGITRACADGHERMSILQQGKNQMLVMQPIQIGDGSKPTYLNLQNAAIEFPQQYNLSSQQVYYCSADNVAGVTFYAASTDTINISSSIWSSSSRFHFKLHTSSTTSNVYDFTGAAVIGAGTISLARATTITGFTINDYSTLDVTGLTLNGSTIKNPPATSASITTSTTARLGTCDIDVSTVTAGNHWWTGSDPTLIFQNCAFTGGGGHALQITIAGGNSITLTGNTWTGFGADTTTGAALSFTATTGTITVNIAGGGTTPTYKSAGATIVMNNPKTLTLTGLISGSDIVIKTSDTNTALVNIDQNAGSTYAYNYSYVAGTYVDIKIMKAGYLPYQVYDYPLANEDASLPIAQSIDRSYV